MSGYATRKNNLINKIITFINKNLVVRSLINQNIVITVRDGKFVKIKLNIQRITKKINKTMVICHLVRI